MLLKEETELNGEKEVESEDEEDRKYNSRREKRRRGKNMEMHIYGHNSTPDPVEAPVACKVGSSKQSATEGDVDDSACVHNGPNSRRDISCSNAHSMQPSDSFSSPSEEEVSDEEVALNGVQTLERTVYEKHAGLIDLLTSHSNHKKTVKEPGGVQGASRKRKAPSTAELPTSKKQCRLE